MTDIDTIRDYLSLNNMVEKTNFFLKLKIDQINTLFLSLDEKEQSDLFKVLKSKKLKTELFLNLYNNKQIILFISLNEEKQKSLFISLSFYTSLRNKLFTALPEKKRNRLFMSFDNPKMQNDFFGDLPKKIMISIFVSLHENMYLKYKLFIYLKEMICGDQNHIKLFNNLPEETKVSFFNCLPNYEEFDQDNHDNQINLLSSLSSEERNGLVISLVKKEPIREFISLLEVDSPRINSLISSLSDMEKVILFLSFKLNTVNENILFTLLLLSKEDQIKLINNISIVLHNPALIRPEQQPNENKIYEIYADGEISNTKGGNAYGSRSSFQYNSPVKNGSNANKLLNFQRSTIGTWNIKYTYSICTKEDCEFIRQLIEIFCK
jgi:hypothetical protein